MKEWEIIVGMALVVACILHSIHRVGAILANGLDELYEKVEAIQEKLEGIEEKIKESVK
jgi:hypothetical protein